MQAYLRLAARRAEKASLAGDERPDVQAFIAGQLSKHAPELLKLLHAWLPLRARLPAAMCTAHRFIGKQLICIASMSHAPLQCAAHIKFHSKRLACWSERAVLTLQRLKATRGAPIANDCICTASCDERHRRTPDYDSHT